MAHRSVSFAFLALLLCVRAQTWSLVRLVDTGALDAPLCLDGSPGAFYAKRGSGSGSNKWVLFQQAGGWAMSPADLVYRAGTALGSTARDPASTTEWSEEDLLTGNTTSNPLFHDWNSVYLRYCDGASRAGHRAEALSINGTRIYVRGADVLRATLDALLSPSPGGDMPSLAAATDVIVAGGSAGGLGVLLHADYVAARVHTAAPAARVRAVANDGFFVDGASIWGGAHVFTGVFEGIAALANATGGAPEQGNGACLATTRPAWRCFLAEVLLPHVATPTFVFNSFQDEYQAGEVLAPDPTTAGAPGGMRPYTPFVPCIHSPARGCNASQYASWRGLGDQILARVRAAFAAAPARGAAHGAFLHSCPTHGTAIFGRATSVRLRGAPGGETAMAALAAWDAGSAPGRLWVDDPWPDSAEWPSIVQPNADCPPP